MARILILDDDVDLLTGQQLYLESKGYEVVTATTGDDAIDRIKEQRPDLVLADLMMEHYDSGFVFCKRAKEQAGMEQIPILMQTAASRKVGFTFERVSPDEQKWMKVDEVLTKPVPLEHLQGKIEQYLAKNTG